jgi:hypothetical protein
MIIDRSLGTVADWWFENRKQIVSPNNRSELNHLLEMCQAVATILEVHNLLRPSKVIFSGLILRLILWFE